MPTQTVQKQYFNRIGLLPQRTDFRGKRRASGRQSILLLGFCGGLGSGKTSLATVFSNEFASGQVRIFNADLEIARLYREPDIQQQLSRTLQLPEPISKKDIRSWLQGRIDKLLLLENILHPALAERMRIFYAVAMRNRSRCIIWDLPLLFEANCQSLCQTIICLRIKPEIRAYRLTKRGKMEDKVADLLYRRQFSSNRQKKLSDHVINNSLSLAESQRKLKKFFIRHGLLSGYPRISTA